MPFYTYICPDGHREDILLTISKFVDTRQCGVCGKMARTLIYPPNLNTNPHRWDYKPDPTRPGVVMNEKAEIHYMDGMVDSEGRLPAEIPVMPEDVPDDLPKEEFIRMAPEIKVGEGECHPADFVPDPIRTREEREAISRKNA